MQTTKRPSRLTPIAQASAKSFTRTGSQKSLGTKSNSGSSGSNADGFKPMNILMFKNGDEYDPGLEMAITRKQFQHWLHLLDYLTDKLKMTEGAVHKIYAYPSGTEVRHFTEMEAAGKFFVAAHGKYKKVKYGKHPRLPSFSTHPSTVSPRYEPPTLNSTDSLQYYLQSHGFKPKLGDIWQDNDFNLMKRKQTAKSEENISEAMRDNFEEEQRNDRETSEFIENQYASPERSKSDFGGKWEKEESQFGTNNYGMSEERYDREEQEEKENTPFKHVIGQRSQSMSSFRYDNQYNPKPASDYGMSNNYPKTSSDNGMSNNNANYDYEPPPRRSSRVGSYGGSRRTSNQDRVRLDQEKESERERTLTLIKKRNMKLQTEREEEERKPVTVNQLTTLDQSVDTADDARYDFLKKEQTYLNDYWKNKEVRSKREKEKPPPIKSRSTSMTSIVKDYRKESSLDRVNNRRPATSYSTGKSLSDKEFRSNRSENRRESRLPRNLPNKNTTDRNSLQAKDRRSSNSEMEKSPKWAEDLAQAVLNLSQRVDQLSARSENRRG